MDSYREEAKSKAMGILYEMTEGIVQQWMDDKELTTYDMNFDERVREETDEHYSLTEADQLLEELSNYLETDSGLWDRQDPRTAISIQASCTYANAINHFGQEILEELQDILEQYELHSENEVTKAQVNAFINIYFELHTRSFPEDVEPLKNTVLKDIENMDFASTGVFCDYLEDKHQSN